MKEKRETRQRMTLLTCSSLRSHRHIDDMAENMAVKDARLHASKRHLSASIHLIVVPGFVRRLREIIGGVRYCRNDSQPQPQARYIGN